MTAAKKLQSTLANAGGAGEYIDDLFSTYLYTGNESTNTITNGIDLANEGGMVWLKNRDTASRNHRIFDTIRGVNEYLESDSTVAAGSSTTLTNFNSDGFTVDGLQGSVNAINESFASWTFRKAPKFFDVVTWTGNGTSGRTISHNLDSEVGCIIVKRTDSTSNWSVYHRSVGNTAILQLNKTNATYTDSGFWNDTSPTTTEFTLGDNSNVNASGGSYVAYLFAHNDGDGEFGESGDQDIIKCGSYTGTETIRDIDIGFEPQFFLVKPTSVADNWLMFDVLRGMPYTQTYNSGLAASALYPNGNYAEAQNKYINPIPNGIRIADDDGSLNRSGNTYIYIAIRRPMKTPESGTEVFKAVEGTGNFTTNFPVDMAIASWVSTSIDNTLYSRLTGNGAYLSTNLTSAEQQSSGICTFDSNTYWQGDLFDSINSIAWMFKRSPGFFDVVAWTGTGSGYYTPHNLGVTPELIIVKNRGQVYEWGVYHKDISSTKTYNLELQSSSAQISQYDYWFGTVLPTDTGVPLGIRINDSGANYIAYLFASLPGISKVGSYTGNGTSQTIDCGFSTGARFVLLKNATQSDNWYVFDTTRGIVAGADPYLKLNTNLAENSEDFIDPANSGFSVSGSDPANNKNGNTYIFLAIA